MTLFSSASTHRPLRAGIALLSAALVVSVAGCGSQATDAEIAAAVDAMSAGESATGAQPQVGQPGPAAVTAPTTVGQNSPAAAGQAPAADAAQPATAGKNSSGAGAKNPQPATGGAPTTSTVANKSEIKVGQLGLFSGVLGAITSVAPKVMAAWVAHTNANGGLNGHPVKLIVADDQGDPSTALTLARRLVESDRVLLMAGNINLFGFPQVENYLRSKNIPAIGDGVDPKWFDSPVAFPVLSPVSVQAVKGLKTFVDGGATKLAMLYCIEVSSLCTYLYEQTKNSEVGKYIVEAYQISLVAPSYTSQCLRMKQAGIEVMYLLMDTAGAARVARDCAAQGLKPKIVLLSVDATADMPGIAALAGSFIPSGTVSPAATGVPGLVKYREIMKTYASSLGDSGISSYGFAAGEMLGLIGRALPDNPTSADFLSALRKVKNETLGGITVPLTYTGGKASAKPCVFIWGTADGRWTAPSGSKPIC